MKKKIYAALAFALYATTFHAQQIYDAGRRIVSDMIFC